MVIKKKTIEHDITRTNKQNLKEKKNNNDNKCKGTTTIRQQQQQQKKTNRICWIRLPFARPHTIVNLTAL